MNLQDCLFKALNSKNKENIDKVFEQIYEKYCNLLFFVTKEYVNSSDGEDIVQDVFIEFFNHIEYLYEVKDLKSYLVVSTRNKCINFVKRNPKIVEFDEEISISNDKNRYFNDLWSKGLSELEKYLIIEHTIVGRKLSEIAKEKNQSPNTIKSIYRRALSKSRKNLGGKDDVF